METERDCAHQYTRGVCDHCGMTDPVHEDAIAALCHVLAAWSDAQGLTCESADDMLVNPALDDAQRAWLSAYITVWDGVNE